MFSTPCLYILGMAAILPHSYKNRPQLSAFLSSRSLSSPHMSGVTPVSRRILPRRRRAEIPNEEQRARRHARDFTHLAPILPESGCSVPDYDKDLPHIPSTSTEHWGAEVAAILTEQMGPPMSFSLTGLAHLPKPSHRAYEQVPITEAQKIAAQYRQRYQSPLDAPPTSETFDKGTLNVSTGNPVESSRSSPLSIVTPG